MKREKAEGMRIFLDTNILFSAALIPGSIPDRVYQAAVAGDNVAVICQQNIDELIRTFSKKFPHKLDALYAFIATISTCIEIVPIPNIESTPEGKIRDIDDRTIYRAALAAGCDVIVTGDKDLLEAGINNPQIITAAEFVALFG